LSPCSCDEKKVIVQIESKATGSDNENDNKKMEAMHMLVCKCTDSDEEGNIIPDRKKERSEEVGIDML
jgi:hypothetical protein